jgi:hypothetical protein
MLFMCIHMAKPKFVTACPDLKIFLIPTASGRVGVGGEVILPLLKGSQKLKGKIWSLLLCVHQILRITDFLDFVHRLISGKNSVLWKLELFVSYWASDFA